MKKEKKNQKKIQMQEIAFQELNSEVVYVIFYGIEIMLEIVIIQIVLMEIQALCQET